uniref:HECT and RLD domain containing E3 ubiquitin protein ligase 4 n=1 Tax=Labrus bergylta TaxID=56723 RepID=A0A3Q3E855_9LABR
QWEQFRVKCLAERHIEQVAAGAGDRILDLPIMKQVYLSLQSRCALRSSSCKGVPLSFSEQVVALDAQIIMVLACGQSHTLAVNDKGGQVFSWGQNRFGQLGLGLNGQSISTPQVIQSLHGVPFAQISAGGAHSFALTLSGAVFGWGRNKFGQLGLNDTNDRCFPILLKSLRSQRVIYISCGEDHTAALTKLRGVFTFGAGGYGQLGHNSTNHEINPRKVFELMGNMVTQISCGRQHTLSFTPSLGKMDSFGLGGNGQLGTRSTSNRKSPAPVKGPWVSSSKLQSKLMIGHSYLKVVDRCHSDCCHFIFSQIDLVFSSASCLNGSFLSFRERGGNLMFHDIMLQSLQINMFVFLCQIAASLEKNLIPRLSTSPPDIEALRLFLTLPECPLFSDRKNYVTITIPFAKSLLCLKDAPLKVLGTKSGLFFSFLLFLSSLKRNFFISCFMAVDQAQMQNFSSMFMPAVESVNPCLILIVRREDIVGDTMEVLRKSKNVDYKKPLKVQPSLIYSGVRKEFFLLIMKELLDPKYGMFRYHDDSRLIWFSNKTFEDIDLFHLIGVICGLAIYNFTIVELNFPVALYKKLLKKKPTLDDLKELQPAVGRSLQQLLDYPEDDLEETFCLNFTVRMVQQHEVNLNTKNFVDAYIDYMFNTSVAPLFECFYAGFHKVCGGKVLELFHPNELQAMVIGNTNYDWTERVLGRPSTIRLFWDVFHDLPLEKKKQFLLFLTGSDRIPILGMKSLKLVIQPTGGGQQYLPVAHTCFNLLDLPKYTSAQTLREKLLHAIDHNQGFNLA